MSTLRNLILAGVAGLAGLAGIDPAQAQSAAAPQPPAAPPATPAPANDAAADKGVPIPAKKPPPPGDEGAPTVTIRSSENGDRVEEYRQNGQIYMVKITPKRGVPYYLYDDNHNGRLDRSDADGHLSPVYYTIYEWDASKPKQGKKK